MSFGMLMPGRNSQSNLQGGFSSGGTTTVNGNTYVSNLTVATRIGNTPNTYKAATSIEFVGEYTDNGGEEYEAFIVNQANPDPNPTTGTVNSNSGDGYRFGYQTQEKVNEIAGEGNHYTAQFWEYDPRLGRRWNLDPKPNPSLSSYSAFANNPIWFTDVKGDTVELVFGKPYTDANGEEHPYGHAALRVFNAKEGYNMVYDFGRYGKVDWNQTTGEGIMNVYRDASKYLASEMKDRSSVGFTQGTSVEQDKQVMSYFKGLTDAGSVYNGGAVPNGGGTAYKLASKYNIFDNNCLTQSCTGLGKIGLNWIGDENDPRDGLKSMEGKFQRLNLTRTEYNKGGLVNVTFKMKPMTLTPLKFDLKPPSLVAPADNTRVVKPLLIPLKKQ